ncbi:MAG TPA: hypothetical protein VFD43_01180 [Planctomycetota bacterium]|nr:hypothetical protein [Planctomycetota bacterium]
MLLPVRADKDLDFWYRTAQSSGPTFAVAQRVNPNDAVLLLVMLDNIGDTGGGQGKVTFRVATQDPAGVQEILGEDIPAWDDALPPPGILVLSHAVPEFGSSAPCSEARPGSSTVWSGDPTRRTARSA